MSKKSAVAAIPPKAAPVVAAPAAVQAAPPAAEGDHSEMVFALLQGGDEFSVTIPSSLHGRWIAKYHGQYSQGSRAYHFLLGHLAQVEKELGLKEGSSGLKDPKKYSTIYFKSEVYSAGGLEELKTKLEALGVTYKRQTKSFHADLAVVDQVRPFMQPPQ